MRRTALLFALVALQLAAQFTERFANEARAGAQVYEPLAASVRAGLQTSIADLPAPQHGFNNSVDAVNWLTEMSARLEPKMPNLNSRLDFLRTVHFEATRVGLNPQLVLALIQVESNFRKYAVSRAGARGYMQVMPFWVGLVGSKGDNLFNLRTNLRYGCVILRHYLEIEKADLQRALGRYNGSLGKSEYPNAVIAAWRATWRYEGKVAALPLEDDALASADGDSTRFGSPAREEMGAVIVSSMPAPISANTWRAGSALVRSRRRAGSITKRR
jgi:soluble lytic murein transglycosylase-like protein